MKKNEQNTNENKEIETFIKKIVKIPRLILERLSQNVYIFNMSTIPVLILERQRQNVYIFNMST